MTRPSFIDAHLHLWDRSVFDYPWLKDADELPFSYDADSVPPVDGRDGIVFIQADCLPEQGLAEARWAAQQLARLPGRAAVVAFAPLESRALGEWLDELDGIDQVVGVRRLLQDEPRELLESPLIARGLMQLAARNLSFDACVRHWQLADLAVLANKVPDARIILDHVGKPPVRSGWKSDETAAWRMSLGQLAALQSVSVKLSGLALEVGDGTFAPQVLPYLEAALELFGADRAMVGSDFPVSSTPPNAPSYDEWFDLVATLGSSPEETDAVLRGTASRVYFGA